MQFLLVATLSFTLASATFFPPYDLWYLSASSGSLANVPSNFSITPTNKNDPIASVCFEYISGANSCANYSTTENPNVWANSSDAESTLIFNENLQALGFQSSSSSPIYWFQSQNVALYQSFFADISGTWILEGSSQHLICYPDAISITPSQLSGGSPEVIAMTYFTTSNCSENQTFIRTGLQSSSATATVWIAYWDVPDPHTSVYFVQTPSAQNELNVQVQATNYPQALEYQRSSNIMISGTWLQDWQSDWQWRYTSPISYQITINSTNSSIPYMASRIIDLTQNASLDSFVAQDFEGRYFDAFLLSSNLEGTAFSYDPSTSTLLSDIGLLLSPNGSLLNSTPFLGLWENPQLISDNSLSSQCCMPTSIFIYQTGARPSSLAVTYILPSNFTTQPGCLSFVVMAFNSQIRSDLSIKTPSLSKITWTDSSSARLSLSDNTSNPQLVIENYNFNACNFSMTGQVSPPFQGIWVLVWQNGPLKSCIPDNFTIAYAGPGFYSIEYAYDQQVLQNFCNNQVIYATLIYQENSNANIWVDTTGQQLNYSETQMAITFSLPNTTQSYWFQLNNGISIPFESFLQTVSGVWFDPQPVSVSESCIPIDSFWVAPSSNQTVQGQVICSIASDLLNITNQLLYISDANLQTITWTDSLTTPSFSIVFSPFTPIEQMTLTLLNTNCSYIYQSALNETFISGSWTEDWQSISALSNQSPITYNIKTVYNTYPTYMISEVTGLQSRTGHNYVTQTPQGLFYDTFFNLTGATFTYDKATNTLLNTEGLLFSSNGSLFNSTSFLGNWTNPQLTDKEAPFPGGCCMPNFVSITNDGNGQWPLQITYYLPSGYSNYPGCQDFSQEIEDYQIQSTLNIATPSLVQLIWTDKIGPQIRFEDPSSTTPKLIVSGFSTNCSFTMMFQPLPPSPPIPPAPLSSNLLSGQIVGLIIGLFIVLNFC